MPTPAESRAYYARKRRRARQDFEAFGIAGTEAPPLRILELLVNVGGSGWNVGDRFTINGGSPGIQPIGRVIAETGNVVDEVVVEQGNYLVDPGGGLATTAISPATGIGLTIDVGTSDLHNFGPTALGADSPFALTMAADAKFAIGSDTLLAIGDVAIGNAVDTYENAEAVPAGGIIAIRQVFRKDQTIVITRGGAAPAANIDIYQLVNGQTILTGTCVFT